MAFPIIVQSAALNTTAVINCTNKSGKKCKNHLTCNWRLVIMLLCANSLVMCELWISNVGWNSQMWTELVVIGVNKLIIFLCFFRGNMTEACWTSLDKAYPSPASCGMESVCDFLCCILKPHKSLSNNGILRNHTLIGSLTIIIAHYYETSVQSMIRKCHSLFLSSKSIARAGVPCSEAEEDFRLLA